MPARSIALEVEDPSTESAKVRRKAFSRTRGGSAGAAKALVLAVAGIILAPLAAGGAASAQARVNHSSDRPFEILDNSFLVEEAFNQERGVFQNILSFTRSDESGWEAVFTQEWPVGTEKHQLSYTLPARLSREAGIGDVLIHYRYQALSEGRGRPALAPRLSIVLPSGSEEKELGNGVIGWQMNAPFSKQLRDVYLHWNAGMTYLPGVRGSTPSGDGAAGESKKVSLLTPQVAASVIWRVRPMVNLMLETLAEFTEAVEPGGSTPRETTITLSPGIRGGWNIGEQQLIVGLALPSSFNRGANDTAVLGYLSYELPFTR